MSLIKKIKKETKRIYPHMVSVRRYIHQNPELSYEEANTSAYVCSHLEENGIPYKAGYCKHGIVAEIKTSRPGGITYLRGDMDALPIVEANDVSYKSKVEGVMHACGHDVHTTCVLGASIVLNKLKEELAGTFRIIFQPGEEKLPGGASIMIKEGAIKNASKANIFGQHVHPPLDAGKVGFYPGEYMASADEIFIDIIGKGGHAALPSELVDTVVVTAHVLVALQTVVSRHSDPKVPAVLSFGKINSVGGASNIIPDKVRIIGTLRTMDEANRLKLHDTIRTIVRNTCKSYGAKARVNIKYGYPTLYNNPELTKQSMDHARDYMGSKNVVMLEKRMSAEDFSYFSQMMPACFYRLGIRNEEKGITSGVHTPTFDIDEKALEVGVGLMAYLAAQNNMK
ncbi:MAG: amidohydrolase [Saprospiraceae bacterium]|nr:amidohydrolase [Bacteroidia bacterium]NNF23130.1 amidohydrolase [Saprospiraceae bacterium]